MSKIDVPSFWEHRTKTGAIVYKRPARVIDGKMILRLVQRWIIKDPVKATIDIGGICVYLIGLVIKGDRNVPPEESVTRFLNNIIKQVLPEPFASLLQVTSKQNITESKQVGENNE